jgi:hypothetical protein
MPKRVVPVAPRFERGAMVAVSGSVATTEIRGQTGRIIRRFRAPAGGGQKEGWVYELDIYAGKGRRVALFEQYLSPVE